MKVTKQIIEAAKKIEQLEKDEDRIRNERLALISWLDGLVSSIEKAPPIPKLASDTPPSQVKGEELWQKIYNECTPRTSVLSRIAQLLTQREDFKRFYLSDLYRYFKASDDSQRASIRHAIHSMHVKGWVQQGDSMGEYLFNNPPVRDAYENRKFRREPMSARKKRGSNKSKDRSNNKTNKVEKPCLFQDWEPNSDESEWLKELFLESRGERLTTQNVYEFLEICDDEQAKARVRASIARMINLGFIEKISRGVYRTAFESINLRQQVLDCIKDNKLKKFEPSDIIELLHVPEEKRDSIRAAIFKMFRAGDLTRDGENKYQLIK